MLLPMPMPLFHVKRLRRFHVKHRPRLAPLPAAGPWSRRRPAMVWRAWRRTEWPEWGRAVSESVSPARRGARLSTRPTQRLVWGSGGPVPARGRPARGPMPAAPAGMPRGGTAVPGRAVPAPGAGGTRGIPRARLRRPVFPVGARGPAGRTDWLPAQPGPLRGQELLALAGGQALPGRAAGRSAGHRAAPPPPRTHRVGRTSPVGRTDPAAHTAVPARTGRRISLRARGVGQSRAGLADHRGKPRRALHSSLVAAFDEPVGQHPVPPLRQHRLGVELHALDR